MSPLTRVRSAVSIATSVPVPMAKLTSAAARRVHHLYRHRSFLLITLSLQFTNNFEFRSVWHAHDGIDAHLFSNCNGRVFGTPVTMMGFIPSCAVFLSLFGVCSGLVGDAEQRGHLAVTLTKTGVLPCSDKGRARFTKVFKSTPDSASQERLPIRTSQPSRERGCRDRVYW